MTVIQPWSGMLTRRLVHQPLQWLTRLPTPTVVACTAKHVKGETHGSRSLIGRNFSSVSSGLVRTYATAASVGRAKAHTGRTTTTTKKTTAAKSPSTKKATSSKKAGRKPVKKTKAKPKPKPKPKTAAKPKTKPKKKVLSTTALKMQGIKERKDLREKALLSEPKTLPDNAWQVYFVENKVAKATKVSDVAQHTRDVAAKYQALSPLERERLNHTAHENKATNEKNYKQWVTQFEPLQIKEANQARRKLAAQKKTPSSPKKAPVTLIKDDRLVKQPKSAYQFFLIERLSSGDFQNMRLRDNSPLIGREWKDLSLSAREKYRDQATRDRTRWVEELKSVYGVEPRARTPSPTA